MVKLIIPNQNKAHEISQIVFDTTSNTFSADKLPPMDKADFLEKYPEFEHPILKQTPLVIKNHKACISYHSYEELQGKMARLFPTLLYHDAPDVLSFEVKAQKSFFQCYENQRIYFSSRPEKKACKQLSINQLNRIMSTLYGRPFTYSNQVLIEGLIKTTAMPDKVQANVLYQSSKNIDEYLQNALNLSFFEIRFIHAKIGFGVFARKTIQKGSLVAVYTGVKNQTHVPIRSYAFKERDCFGLSIDAYSRGNISRFFNHAPKEARLDGQNTANLLARIKESHGIKLIVFYALTDIAPGEQLLFQYNQQPFEKGMSYAFKNQTRLYDETGHRLKAGAKDKAIQRIISQEGMHQVKKFRVNQNIVSLIIAILFILMVQWLL